MELLQKIFEIVAEAAAMLFELAGLVVIIVTGVKGAAAYLNGSGEVKSVLLNGFSISLEFFLGGEILHTLLASDYSRAGLVALIFVIRAAITYLIHWELHGSNHGEKRR